MTESGYRPFLVTVVVFTVLFGFLFCPKKSEAGTTVDSQPYQGWVDGSAVPTPDMPVAVVTDGAEWPCGEAVACMEPGTIWMSPQLLAEASQAAVKMTFLHELGHEFDWAYMTDASRRHFENVIQRSGTPWWGLGIGADPTSPAETFADNYAACAAVPVVSRADSPLAPVCALVRHVARGPHYPPMPSLAY